MFVLVAALALSYGITGLTVSGFADLASSILMFVWGVFMAGFGILLHWKLRRRGK
jgi:hypothetical protein